MRTVVVRNGARIPLGKQGENNAVRVVWPRIAEKYAELYGDGRFELVAVQKGQAYPAVVSVDGADLIWNVLAADVAIAEVGSLELIYYVGDTIAKSQTWETFVEVSKSAEGTTEPPEPAKNWVDGVIKSSSDAKQSATESAESARQSAESATNAAASATKAENAVEHSPIIGENGNWFIWDFEKSEYVDSGKSASTPPITPETAGKYLTNDGSKAEWEAIDISQSDWEQTDESAADYVKNRPFGNFAHHSIDFYYSGDYRGRVKKAPTFDELLNTVGEKTARLEAGGSIYCQGTAVTMLDEVYGNITITFTSDDKLNELVFSGRYGRLTSLSINKSNINWDTWYTITYSLFIDGLTYTEYQKLSSDSVEGTLPHTNVKDYIPVSSGDGSWVTRSIESINPIFQLSGASAGQIVKITAVDESGKPTAWEAVDMPTGGADLSLGITGATVGQIVKITEVDTDGKPTKWQAVNDRLPEVTPSDDGKALYVEQIGEFEYGYGFTDIPDINTFIPLGITGASPGQFAKVKYVDDIGQPTVWEAVDMTGGGGGETWELIAEIDFDVDAANNVSVWEYKNLPNYKELAYRKLSLVGSTETASGLSISINDGLASFSSIQYAKIGGQSNGWGKILLLPFGWIHANSGSATSPTNYAFGGLQAMYNAIPFDGDSITSVKLSEHPIYKIAGGKLSLYGRR